MINLCFLSGKVKNEIDFKFIYNAKTKRLSKKHTSIVLIDLEIDKEQVVKAYAYDKTADWIYQNIDKDEVIYISGRMRDVKVEIFEILY
ncbi:MAG: hypothetical protein HFJ29_08265 [Clostridia bacterium]|nr:hypothetical protein [Clostridia bacterium]